MKFAFFGTPEFAAIILEKLIGFGYVPEIAVCNPDRPVGRKRIITAPPVKTGVLNLESGIKSKITILQPEKLDSKFQISGSRFDFFVVAAYAKILPKAILAIPRLGSIGVHPSLLPKYRGSSPIQSTILNGDEETGVTMFLMDERIDHGLILKNSKFRIPDSKFNYSELSLKLAELGGDLLIETLPKFIRGEIKPEPQDETQATYTGKFTTEDGYVDLDKDDPVTIERKIRALNPEPGVWTTQNGKRVKILEGEIVAGKLKLTKIQVEGKQPTILHAL